MGAIIIDRLSADALAEALASHDDFRVLRRLAPVSRFHEPNGATRVRVGVVVDVETTGLDRDADKVIELCLQRFRFCSEGRIIEVGQPRLWRENPGLPLPPEITRLTGLTDRDLEGQAIDEALACQMLGSADVIVAHNAAFDRPFVERRLPAIAGRAWACSMADVDWPGLGFDGKALAHLVAQCGWFYEAHRAENDVLAILYLLAHRTADGATICKHLMTRAERSTWRVHAVDSPFDSKARLKSHGYRWDAVMKYWWKELSEAELFAERAWLAAEVYTGWGEPKMHEVTWLERYS